MVYEIGFQFVTADEKLYSKVKKTLLCNPIKQNKVVVEIKNSLRLLFSYILHPVSYILHPASWLSVFAKIPEKSVLVL